MRGDGGKFKIGLKTNVFFYRALRPAVGLKHANTVKFLVGKVGFILAHLFYHFIPLLHRLFGALELPGQSPIMPTTTPEAGKVIRNSTFPFTRSWMGHKN